jgi:hypothetical protein
MALAWEVTLLVGVRAVHGNSFDVTFMERYVFVSIKNIFLAFCLLLVTSTIYGQNIIPANDNGFAKNPVVTDGNADVIQQQYIKKLHAAGLNTCVNLNAASENLLTVIPRLNEPVVDTANILSKAQTSKVNKKIYDFENETGSQLAVITTKELINESMFSFAHRAACTYKLGRKGVGDGVILFIALKDRKVFLYVYNDVSLVVRDDVAKTIIDNKITPNFKEGMFFEGITSALNEVSELMRNKFPPRN